MMKHFLKSTIVIFLGLILMAGPVMAGKAVMGTGGNKGTRVRSLPMTITQPGFYYLTRNLNGTLTIEADDVVLDLMGFKLSGGTQQYGIFMEGRKNVTIRNGSVCNHPGAAIIENSSIGQGHVIQDLRMTNNGQTWRYPSIQLKGSGHVVERCTIIDNYGSGIEVENDSRVMRNLLYSNGYNLGVVSDFFGIHASGSGCHIIDNVVMGSIETGIGVYSGATIRNNVVNDNQETGIMVELEAVLIEENAVMNNNLSDALTCEGIEAYRDCTVRKNMAADNKRANIRVRSSDNVIINNHVKGSTGYGIDFDVSGSFYQGNTATQNTLADFNNTAGQYSGGNNVSY